MATTLYSDIDKTWIYEGLLSMQNPYKNRNRSIGKTIRK